MLFAWPIDALQIRVPDDNHGPSLQWHNKEGRVSWFLCEVLTLGYLLFFLDYYCPARSPWEAHRCYSHGSVSGSPVSAPRPAPRAPGLLVAARQNGESILRRWQRQLLKVARCWPEYYLGRVGSSKACWNMPAGAVGVQSPRQGWTRSGLSDSGLRSA